MIFFGGIFNILSYALQLGKSLHIVFIIEMRLSKLIPLIDPARDIFPVWL